MDWTANYVNFVIAAYALSGVVLSAVLVWTLLRAKSLKAQLETLNLSDPGARESDA